MQKLWYWMYKNVLIGPFLRVWNRPTMEGRENIPAEGAAIVASTHQAVMDSFYFPALSPRRITFPAKSEYFTNTGVIGTLQRWFFTSIGQIPVESAYRLARFVDRPDADAIFLSCTNLATLGVIEAIEQELGKPVVTSNQATFWACLRVLGIGLPISGYGRLLSECVGRLAPADLDGSGRG